MNTLMALLVALGLYAVPEPEPGVPPWLAQARADIGTNPTDYKYAWCGRYFGDFIEDGVMPGPPPPPRNAYDPPRYAVQKALNWVYYGKPTTGRIGALAIIDRTKKYGPGRGHIGVVNWCDQAVCSIVSGNVGRPRRVHADLYYQSEILAFRWPCNGVSLTGC